MYKFKNCIRYNFFVVFLRGEANMYEIVYFQEVAKTFEKFSVEESEEKEEIIQREFYLFTSSGRFFFRIVAK